MSRGACATEPYYWYPRCWSALVRRTMDNYPLNFYAIPPLVTGLAMLVLGVGVLVRERYSRVAVACFVMADSRSSNASSKPPSQRT
jgi:hypothetical protein